ncbi:TetR/AcrR family transcriptional regulator [Rhizobium sp. BK377]|uniref:TetR/AcrR family transcriptional regulator n=1 Tax=Rhizobium sp. BK377 TaxID=2587058 RepID=UPI0028A66E3D|nr:TetR/AcrR family transcriptional regulator [Rhizobium sp. BK377]
MDSVMPSRPIAVEKRQHIIETAYILFKRDGFHATGIDRIIAEAEVAKMTMYRHFPSKDGLIVEVLNWRTDRFKRQLDRLSETAMTPDEMIMAVFDWHERWFESPDFHGCLFQHALAEFPERDHAVYLAVMRQKQDLQGRIREIVAQSMPEGRVPYIAMTLFMLIEGAMFLAQMGQGKEAIDNARKVAADLLAARRRQ